MSVTAATPSVEDLTTGLDLSQVPYLDLFYNIPMRLIGSLLCGVNLTVGFLGNILVILVVLTAKTRMLTPTNCYLVSLSAADLVVLVVGSVSLITELNSIRDHWILGGLIGCQMTVYLTYVGVNTSAFSITAFSVERYIAICHPISAQTACTVKRAKRIIFGVWLFGLLYNSPWIYLAMIKQKSMFNGSLVLPACGHRYNRSNLAYMSLYLGDLVLFYLIPLILLTIMYSLIARVLFSTGTPANQTGGAGSSSAPLRSSNSARIQQSKIQVVKMLFVVVVLFALLWLPYRFLVAYNSIAPRKYRISSEWYVVISRLLVYCNSAVNPVIYNAMSVKFRREFQRLFGRLCTKLGSRNHGHALNGASMTGSNTVRNASLGRRPNSATDSGQPHQEVCELHQFNQPVLVAAVDCE